IEYYELDPPQNPQRAPYPRPHPDVVRFGHRDHGNRVGVWRLLDVMDRLGLRGSVSLSVAVCDHHPEIIRACADRGWEFFSHGTYNTRYVYGLPEAQERSLIQDSIDTVRRATGQELSGWLGPALTHTERTFELLAEHGIRYVCDLFHDDQPQPLRVPGRMISLPYSWEINDFVAYYLYGATPRRYGDMLRAQFDQLYAEGGTVVCVPLHPFLAAQAHRIGPIEDALAYMLDHDGVWAATGREIAAWYDATHYAAAVARQEAP
ncbi:MAG: polysaccharide deacetylase family protein, partial [Chloroflexi bacterium]|nr:polysaccharide deacetylase family protein [Chloroflexota bacterium]